MPAPALPEGSTLFDLLPIGAYRSSVDGRLLRANAALVRLNGYRSEAELVDGIADIAREWYVQPGRRAEFQRLLAEHGQVRGLVSEVWRHRTRERIWVSENAHVVHDAHGNLLCYEGTIEEVTDRMRIQQALEHSEAQLRLIAEQLPGVVYLTRLAPDGTPHFVFISDGVRELYGVEPAEALRDGRVLQRMRHPDDAPRVEHALRAAERAQAPHGETFRIVRRDGGVRWVQGSSSPIRSAADGDMRCGLIIDVTERQQAEAWRAERDRAEASRQTIVALLSRISHELRTPLNAVLGFAQLLERDPSLGARQHQFAVESLRAGRHLLALVDDVIDLSRAEGGQFALALETVDPGPVVEECRHLLASAAAEGGVALALPAGPMPALRADPRRLRQVLTNLLSNAVKYNRPGGRVALHVQRDGERVQLAVEDDGPGLSADQQSRLFQPFQRLGAERGAVPGTGLGLTLSLQLARAMGGDIEVLSVPGRGSRFTLLLPAA